MQALEIIQPLNKNVLTFLNFISFLFQKNNLFIYCLCILFACKTTQQTTNKKNVEQTSPLAAKEELVFKNLFFDANRYRLIGNYDEAEQTFLKALKVNPKSAAALYELANVYAIKNDKKQALNYSKQAAALDSKNVWYQLLYVNCLNASNQFAETVTVYENLIKNNPQNIDFYYELANVYMYLNKPNDAIRIYNKIEEQIGITKQTSLSKLNVYRKSNNFDKALEETKKLIKTFPKEPQYYDILGSLYLSKGMSEKALEAYTDLLKIDSTNAQVHLSLADYYRTTKQNDKAFKEIKIAFLNKDLNIDTKIQILLSYYSITESYPALKSDADTLCKIITTVHADDAKAFAMYADFLYRDKKLDEARSNYRKAIALDKEKYAIWNQLLIIESELNDFAAMEKESKEAMELFPNQALTYFFNGVSNVQLKNYKEAVEALTEGKEFVYENPLLLAQFYATIGDSQNQLKKYDESDAAYDKALELDPSNSYVLNNYAYYLSLRNKDLEKAEEMSKKSNKLVPNNNSYQDTYGWILYQMKKYDDAKTWIGKAIENGGKSNGTLFEHYGDVLYQLGNKEEALKYWIDAKKFGGTTDLIDKKIEDKKLYE